ncbi:MAG: hypothetical protein QM662_13695 [Gordonia sp. (in: high G+C Gram-positive bacteria)]
MTASLACAWTDADLSAVTGIAAPASSTAHDVGEWSAYAREYQSIYALYAATTAELAEQHTDSPRGGVADHFVVADLGSPGHRDVDAHRHRDRRRSAARDAAAPAASGGIATEHTDADHPVIHVVHLPCLRTPPLPRRTHHDGPYAVRTINATANPQESRRHFTGTLRRHPVSGL